VLKLEMHFAGLKPLSAAQFSRCRTLRKKVFGTSCFSQFFKRKTHAHENIRRHFSKLSNLTYTNNNAWSFTFKTTTSHIQQKSKFKFTMLALVNKHHVMTLLSFAKFRQPAKLPSA